MKYKNTQIGYLVIAAILAAILIFGFIMSQIGFYTPLVIFALFILFLLMSFISLQTTIDKNYLRIKFGYGIFKKKFLLNDIASVKTVKNHWYYGWGIRLWLWPYMWIYNVSGFHAVEIVMKDKKIFRIGTNKPVELKNAILKRVK